MGIWKGRFPWLRNIRMVITDDPKSLKKIMMYIDASVVLHNMLIQLGDSYEMNVNNDWDLDADMSDIDDNERIPEARVLDLPVPRGAHKTTRRDQLKEFIREAYVKKYNYQPLDGFESVDGFEPDEDGTGYCFDYDSDGCSC